MSNQAIKKPEVFVKVVGRTQLQTTQVTAPRRQVYILKTAKMLKKTPMDSLTLRIDHEHIYYTTDESGKQQATSAAVGNHFHEMLVTQDARGNTVVLCSRPKKIVKRKINNVWTSVIVDFPEDDHTHAVESLDR